MIGGTWVNDSGYLISGITKRDDKYTYREVTFSKDSENILQEYIGDNSNSENLYKYVKVNGVKYYYDDDYDNGDGTIGKWFSLLNGSKLYTDEKFNTEYDNSAYYYYQEACDFTKRCRDDYNLDNLMMSDACDTDGTSLENNDSFSTGNYKIFDFDNNIEEPTSNFNQHRLSVIKYSIEKNLSVAIANYNYYSGVTIDFRMPKLTDAEWTKILNNVSLISFMQGLSIGGKVYSGYSIVTNNNNEEVVTENSIYIVTGDYTKSSSVYHNIRENALDQANDISIGVFNTDFQRKSTTDNLGITEYYYQKPGQADYGSVVTQSNMDYSNSDNIYKYLEDHPKLTKVYYTALGRERYSMYKTNRDSEELLKNYE